MVNTALITLLLPPAATTCRRRVAAEGKLTPSILRVPLLPGWAAHDPASLHAWTSAWTHSTVSCYMYAR
eukprot:COSAG01_NODE_633_length_14669_cov_7.174056_1_plen_69_part_00